MTERSQVKDSRNEPITVRLSYSRAIDVLIVQGARVIRLDVEAVQELIDALAPFVPEGR